MALRRAAAPTTADMEGLLAAFVTSVFFAALIDALGRSLLAPGRPTWRLAPMSDAVVDRPEALSNGDWRRRRRWPASSPAPTTSLEVERPNRRGRRLPGRADRTGRRRLRPDDARPRTGVRAAMAEDDEPPARSRALWVLAAVAAWLALAATLVALIAGYLALATFVMRELIWIALVLASLFLLLRFVDDLCQALFSARHPARPVDPDRRRPVRRDAGAGRRPAVGSPAPRPPDVRLGGDHRAPSAPARRRSSAAPPRPRWCSSSASCRSRRG